MKITRREFGKLSSFAVVSACLPETFVLTGCSVDQVIGLIQDAALIASAAGPLIPGYGPIISLVGTGLNDLAGLYTKYEAAKAAEKAGIAGEIHAVTSTALSNLQTIYTDARIKDPQLQAEITAFVSAANTAIVALETKIGAPANQPTNSKAHAMNISQARALPVLPKAKSGDDLKVAWNDAVKAEHPEAVIQ